MLVAKRVAIRTIDRDDEGEVRQARAQGGDLGDAGRVRDDRAHAGVRKAIIQRIDAKERGERQGDGAEFVDRDMGDDDLSHLRQEDGDAVPMGDAKLSERAGETVGLVGKPRETQDFRRVAAAKIDDRGTIRVGLRPDVRHGDADIEPRWNVPAEVGGELGEVAGVRQHGGVRLGSRWRGGQ